MSSAVGNASYRVRVDGVLSPAQFMPFQVMGFTVHNLTADDVKVLDDRGNAYTVHSGGTQSFNPPDPITVWRAGTYDATSGNLKTSSGYATVEFFNYRVPLNNNPQSNLPGTVPVAIQSGSVSILGSPVVTLAAGQSVIVSSITGNVTVQFAAGQSVSISGTPQFTLSGTANVAITGGGTVNIQNVPGGLIGITNAPPIATRLPLNNQTGTVTLSRSSAQVTVQCRTDTLARSGLLTILYQVTATDTTVQPYYLIQQKMYYADSYPNQLEIPYSWDLALPAGSAILVIFTGQMDIIVTY